MLLLVTLIDENEDSYTAEIEKIHYPLDRIKKK